MSTTGKLYPIAILTSFMVATCTDYDPLAVDGASPDVGEQELSASFASADGHRHDPSGGTAEPFRHRLSITLDFDGELVPNETITLQLEGVATEKLTGGEVHVMLPTMAAMKHAGPDKYPSYPVGKEIPAVASWDYAASAALNNASRWESVNYPVPSGRDAAEIEGYVAALLNDLIDSASDGDDSTSYPVSYVTRVFETCRADGTLRDDVTDFVWCLENRVNSTVHDDSFPHGPDAPDRVRESASEPSDWSASEIRDTWLQNVG